jgi:Flp pilus assembly protein CpaB
MAEAPAMPRVATTTDPTVGPTIRPRRSLPGGRAVIGAFLVIVAAVGTFGAYLQATAAPATSFMVAGSDLQIGDVIEEEDLVGGDARFLAVPMELPEAQAGRAFTSSPADAESLLGQVVVAPVRAGDLLTRSMFVAVADAGPGVSLSFSLPVDRALAGRISPGELVDIIATFPSSGTTPSQTRIVARGITVIAVPGPSEGINGGRVMLTVEVLDLDTAQRIQHAVDAAQIAILRGADPTSAIPPAATGGTVPPTAPAASAPAESTPEQSTPEPQPASPQADGEQG